MSAAEIATALGNARREGRTWRCRCPLHGGRTPVPASEAERPLEPGAQPLAAGGRNTRLIAANAIGTDATKAEARKRGLLSTAMAARTC